LFSAEEPKLVLVDIDGTLTKGEKAYWIESPDPDREMIDFVEELYNAGHHVVVWTARSWDSVRETVAWLTEHGVRYHGIRMEKGGADTYIDDKTVRPEEIKGVEN